MSDLSGKTIIVTGGGSGIGRATVELLVASGANVAVADINDEAGEAVVAASGGKAAYFRCDIAQEEDVKALVAQTLAAFGGLDGAFNNAAIPQAGLPLAEVSLRSEEHTSELQSLMRISATLFPYTALFRSGRATVGVLVASGANAAVADINDEAGEAVVAASGGKAAYFRCDIAQEEDVKALVAQTLAAFGGLDGAFNNAAIPQAGLPLAEVSL